MDNRVVGWIRTATGAGFGAGVLLIGLGLAGLSASLPLSVGVLAVGVGATFGRRHLRDLVDHPATAAYLGSVPLSLLVAGAVLVLFPGASPGELQTVGGVIGLLAILNHLLRPVYALLAYLFDRVSSVLA